MVNESDETTYDDDAIQGYIETYPLLDERGEEPYTWDTSTSPPTQDENEDWVVTYDLHAAAADIWEEKAATRADYYDYSTEGKVQASDSQRYEQMMKMARYHRSRRSMKTITQHKWPEEDETKRVWIGNLAEED